MYFIALFICIAFAVILGVVMPKKENHNKLDRVGFIFNIILSVLYIPTSLYGIFSLFAADSMFMYSETIQKIIGLLITVGIVLPFVSVLSIVLSFVFRKNGRSILSFVIQFIPLVLFIVMVVAFELISKISL